ncbi:hypothetical protein QFC19_004716 [Naganishia cerealis]|uniref:Uncharacterized protein n=1 Tax=Naganishia cerealis TaxID=610337 RepID=A0ACC2VTD7_9TREE|nr:hypothetical protein QFC19_004716 [Naganishia cerealis]
MSLQRLDAEIVGAPSFLHLAKDQKDAAKAEEAITEEAEANDKGDTGYAVKTYAKACKSIAACPIPYSNLNELLSLQYVGKVMLSKLIKKQKEYYLARGMEIPANGGGGLGAGADDAQSVEAAPKASAATGGSSPKAPARSRAAVNNDESDPGEAGDSAFNMRLQAGAGSKSSF